MRDGVDGVGRRDRVPQLTSGSVFSQLHQQMRHARVRCGTFSALVEGMRVGGFGPIGCLLKLQSMSLSGQCDDGERKRQRPRGS